MLTSEKEKTQAELLRYLKLLVAKRYLFVIISLCAMSFIVWGSYMIPKKYEGKSIIFIESNVIEQLVKGIAITPSMDGRIKVLRDTMLSRSLVLSVLRKLDLDTRAENDQELEQMIIDFQSKTNIMVKNGNLITVSFVNKNPVLARDYINSLVREYVEKNVFAKREEAYDATKFLNRQVEFFKAKMDKGEKSVIQYRQEQGIYIVMDEGTIIKEINDYMNEIEKMDIRENELLAAKSSVQRQLKSEKPFSVTMYDTSDTDGTIGFLEDKLKKLLFKYTDNYPEVIKIKTEIEALKKQSLNKSEESSNVQARTGIESSNPVYVEMKQKLIEIETEIDSIQAKKKYLNKLLSKKEEELKEIPESRKELADLEKERDSFKGVYEQLLVRLGQSEVSKQMEVEDKTTTFRIIEPAILPSIPISPNRKLIIIAGIILGILAGGGVVFVMDFTNNSIKTIDSLKTLRLPVLAVIPRIRSAEEQQKTRRKDVLVFSIAGIYMLCILGVLAMELLGLTYIENIFSSIFMKEL